MDRFRPRPHQPAIALLALLGLAPLALATAGGCAAPPGRLAAAASPADPAAAAEARAVLNRFGGEEPGWKLRMESILRIARAGGGAVPALIEALESGAPVHRRIFAAQSLALLGDPRARPAFERALDDSEAMMRSYAIQGLALLGRDGLDAGRLETILAADPSRSTRVAAAWALERDDGPRESAAVRAALLDYDSGEMDTARLHGPAPAFALTDPSGRTYRLDDFRGRKAVILKFTIEPL